MTLNRNLFTALAAVTGLFVGASGASGATLVVTEFLPDPSGTDIDREWFEIYNAGSSTVNLAGYAAGDGTDPANASAGEGMGVFPAGASIEPGEVIVVAANANGFNAFYGFLPDYEFANTTSTLGLNPNVPDLTQKSGWGATAGSLGIANGGDDIGILSPDSTVESFSFVDGGNHGNITTFYPGAVTLTANQTYERVPATQDTDAVGDWVVRTSGTGTPGAVTVPEPAAFGLLAVGGALSLVRRKRPVAR